MCVCAGRATGSGRPAGAEEDRAAASGWIRFPAHRYGFLQDERGTSINFHESGLSLTAHVLDVVRWSFSFNSSSLSP